jgi:hypothetical protein
MIKTTPLSAKIPLRNWLLNLVQRANFITSKVAAFLACNRPFVALFEISKRDLSCSLLLCLGDDYFV